MSRVIWEPTFAALTAAGVAGPVVDAQRGLTLSTAMQEYGREYDSIVDGTPDRHWWIGASHNLESNFAAIDIDAERPNALLLLLAAFGLPSTADAATQLTAAQAYQSTGHPATGKDHFMGAIFFISLELTLADLVRQGVGILALGGV